MALSKKTLIAIIGGSVLAVALIAGGIYWFLSASSEKKEKSVKSKEKEEEEAKEFPFPYGLITGALYPMKPFVVNLGGLRDYLKISVTLEFYELEIPYGFEGDIALIRDAYVRHLSSKTKEELLAPGAKPKLARELVELTNKSTTYKDVENVFITEFIIQ